MTMALLKRANPNFYSFHNLFRIDIASMWRAPKYTRVLSVCFGSRALEFYYGRKRSA